MPDPITPTYFRVFRRTQGPPWLTEEGDSGTVGYSLDALKDAFVERLRLGLLARFPQQDPSGTPAPDDALVAIGRDRRIVRGISETSKAYAARLLTWLDAWRGAGSAFALMDQLAAFMGPLPQIQTVDMHGKWYIRLPNGTRGSTISLNNWDWDGQPSAPNWSRFWVIIYPNGLWTQGPNWGDPGAKWGDTNRTWGSTMLPGQADSLRAIIADWKPAGTTCVNIILAFDNTSFNPTGLRDGAGLPDGTWGSWAKVSGGDYVPSRLLTARFLDGV